MEDVMTEKTATRLEAEKPAESGCPTNSAWVSTGFMRSFAPYLLLSLTPGAALALPPSPPLAGIEFQANQAFVGDPLLGMEPGDAGSLYEFFPDVENHMASTTKTFTLLLAVEAVESGYVNLSDLVLISPKAANINDKHNNCCHSNEGLVPGIQIQFEDLLYSMILTSAGDSTIAIAQHVAVSMDPTLEDESDALQEAAFTDMMNARAAELGLDDTFFFNAYGGDHIHGYDNTPGINTDHGSSARDMARWFAVGMEYPLFRKIVGFSGTWTFGSWNSQHVFSLSGGDSYPGWTGSKAGGGGPCGNCGIDSAKRIGREVVQAYTQGRGRSDPPGDYEILLDYGFARLFHPEKEAGSAVWTGGWIDEDLACLTQNVAASAVVDGTGDARLLIWDVDVDAGTVEHANPITLVGDAAGNFAPSARNPFDGRSGSSQAANDLKVVSSGTDSAALAMTANVRTDTKVHSQAETSYAAEQGTDYVAITGAQSTPFSVYEPNHGARNAYAARITDAGFGHVAVVEETDQGIYLRLYGVNNQNIPFLVNEELVGEGTKARVTRINAPSGTFILTAYRDTGGGGVLDVFKLDPSGVGQSMLLSHALDTLSFPMVDEFEIGNMGDSSTRFVVAMEQLAGGRMMRSYNLNHVAEQLEWLDTWSFNAPTKQISVTHVAGLRTRDSFAIGFVNGSNRPSVEVFEMDNLGEITNRGKSSSDEEILPSEALRIARYRDGGAMLAYQDGGSQRLEVWSFDASVSDSSIKPNMLTREGGLEQEGLHGFCRLPGNEAEGDFLLTQGAVDVEGLRVQAWRSAPRN